MLYIGLSGESRGDKVLWEDEGEPVGEVIGEVRGERHNQGAGTVGELDSKPAMGKAPMSDEEPLLPFIPKNPLCLSVGESKFLSGTRRKLPLPNAGEKEFLCLAWARWI